MKCKICNSEESIRSFAMHLRYKHFPLKTEDYVKQYGEFRPKQLKNINKKVNSSLECEICKEKLISHKNLIHHLHLHPEITWQEYFIKYFFDGIHPTCKCGCNQKTTLLRNGKNGKGEKTFCREIIKGHSYWIKPGYNSHSVETKLQMRQSAIKRLENEKGLFKGISKIEKELVKFIKENYKDTIELNNTTILSGLEIDIYLPNLKLSIELNGTYYHSDLFKDKNFHLKKTKECNNQGIKLIHIWDSDWYYKKEIVKSLLLNQLNKTPNKIPARKCEIKIVNSKNTSLFLNQNHLQGGCISKINLGLYYNNELVSIMTFGKLRKNLGQKHKEGSYELLRFCNKLNTNVIGGASKLFKYFIDNYNPKQIISYANRDWSNGKLYEKLNMIQLPPTPPGYHWYKSKIRYNRFKFRKDILVKEGYDPFKTEYEIMTERGFYRTWNTGNLKFIWQFIK